MNRVQATQADKGSSLWGGEPVDDPQMVGDPVDLAKLAHDAAVLLITGATTDIWANLKSGMARIFGRGESQRIREFEARLDELQDAIIALGDTGDVRTRERHAFIWQGRIMALLETYPDAVEELEAVIAAAQDEVGFQRGEVLLTDVTANDNSTQIVVGKGQVNFWTGSSYEREPMPRQDEAGGASDA